MKQFTLQEIQAVMLENMVFLDRLCRQEHLTYYLAYGTLLGAVRHHNFIPWDDDTDIWMPREDYNHLIAYCKSHAEEIKPYRVCSRSNTKNFPYGIIRFSNQNYQYITTNSFEKQFDIGVFTDIYPLDPYGDNLQEANALYKKFHRLNLQYARYCSGKSDELVKKILKPVNYAFLHLIHGEDYDQRIDQEVEKLLHRYTRNDNALIGVPTWEGASKKPVVFHREDFMERVDLDFDGKKLSAPAGWDRILTTIYGDYMTPPPVEDRNPYHGYIVTERETEKK